MCMGSKKAVSKPDRRQLNTASIGPVVAHYGMFTGGVGMNQLTHFFYRSTALARREGHDGLVNLRRRCVPVSPPLVWL